MINERMKKELAKVKTGIVAIFTQEKYDSAFNGELPDREVWHMIRVGLVEERRAKHAKRFTKHGLRRGRATRSGL